MWIKRVQPAVDPPQTRDIPGYRGWGDVQDLCKLYLVKGIPGVCVCKFLFPAEKTGADQGHLGCVSRIQHCKHMGCIKSNTRSPPPPSFF